MFSYWQVYVYCCSRNSMQTSKKRRTTQSQEMQHLIWSRNSFLRLQVSEGSKWKKLESATPPLCSGTSGGGTGKIASNIHRPPPAAAQRQVLLQREQKNKSPLSSFQPFNLFIFVQLLWFSIFTSLVPRLVLLSQKVGWGTWLHFRLHSTSADTWT